MDLQGNSLGDFLQNNGHGVLQKVENNHSLRYFTENELRHITNGYSTLLGKGAFGEVYKGVLENKSTVAVKRYIQGTQKEDFAKEVIVHSQINHKNVVRLFGCCAEENALMIVMEFVSNGNLDTLLHCSNNNGHIPFPLYKRLDIAIQISEVLWCMHSMYSPVLHGDIKPANILLDKNLTPKISDFGIARMLSANGSQYTKNFIGSVGYVDPAYCETGILTPKSDVYSFGVVLLEIITRKKAVDGTTQCFNRASDKVGKMMHMLDEYISDRKNIKFLKDVVKIVARCLVKDVKVRPEMIEVVTSLRRIQEALLREQGNVCQQHSSALKTSILLADVESKAHHFGDLNIFEEMEIRRMTKNYRKTFREEYCERLYHGILGKDHPVIVRQLRTSSETERQTFLNTMSLLSQKNHKSVANVIGFHLGESISACVYESCGDLSKSMLTFSLVPTNRNLYDTISSMEVLPLHQRLSIAVQCLEGLVHIHSLAAEHPDLYGTSLFGNFRSANIFLDSNYAPKVFNANLSTFLGLSAVLHNATTTFGINNHGSEKYYLNPRDVSAQLLNQKSDVYSFGVVLLELMTWKTVIYKINGTTHLLTTDFLDAYRKSHNAVKVFGKSYDVQDECFLHEAIAVAVECLTFDFQKRPKLSYVLSLLQNIRRRLAELTISQYELNKITCNYGIKSLVRQDSLGTVFLGVHEDGQKWAIKKFNLLDDDSIRMIWAIQKIPKHDNVVSLEYFIDRETHILAYEYTPIGSLQDILHGTKDVKGYQTPLSWMQRVKIAVSAARGIEFLLHERAEHLILNSTIKSSNIFIFEGDVAKIGYDIPPKRHLKSTNRKKEPCYYHPSYKFVDAPETADGMYSEKSGTYSFGDILLELLTGRKAPDHALPCGQQEPVNWGISMLTEDKVEQCVDPRLGGAYPSKLAVTKFAAVAALCVHYEPDFRPNMSEVVKMLEALLDA